LKVRLDEVYKIVDRVMTTIDNNPEILTNLTGGVGKGVKNALSGGNSIEGTTSVEKDENDDDEEDDG